MSSGAQSRTAAMALRMAGAAVLACALIGAVASRAQAEDRYVTVGGSGAECTQPKPCSLATGLDDAVSGDTVHVDGDGGPYLGVASVIGVATGVTVVGEGAVVPRIVFGAGQLFIAPESSITRFELSRTSGAPVVLLLAGATGSRLVLESGTGLPVEIRNSVLRDSVVRQTGENLTAIQASDDNTIRNVTAIATGPGSTAISNQAADFFLPPPDCFFTGTLDMRNTIARGVEWDLASTGSAKCPAPIDAGHSSYRAGKVRLSGTGAAVNDLGGNQTAVEPLLAADGYHQLPGSPTIEAGIATAENGPTDIDGEPRTQGPALDIGADETLLPPPPPPVPLDLTAPVGSNLRFGPKRFRPRRARTPSVSVAAGAGQKRRKPVRRSSRVSYRLTEAATVRFLVQRRAIGRRVGKRCVVGKRARKLPRARKCRRLVGTRSFSHAGLAGANRFRFSGFVAGKALRPGAYRMTGIPTDAAGNRGPRFRASFAIVRR